VSDPNYESDKAIAIALEPLLDCELYDWVPDGAGYPYVTFDSMLSQERDHLVERIDDRFIYLTVWSRARGSAEVKKIMSQIDQLTGQKLPMEAGSMVSLRVVRKRTIREADGLTYQGQVTLRVITTH